MNTSNIKKYAPQARKAFMGAVMKKINELGIYSETQISDATQQGTWLVVEGRNFDIKIKRLRERLISRVQNTGFLVVVEHIAYTWFNRLCAIRYMELHDYLDHGLRVLSHPDNDSGFEILEHAQDVAEDLGLNRDQIIELKLAGNQDELLYRTLLLGQCHKLHQAMPFLFEAIDDETELLLPDNLTRTDSILRGLVNDIPAQDWEQVEIIGWLYQFYISEKKDEVIGKVVKSEDIPAATQLFTPNWIVKYLVQNSVGRQWLQTYPDSKLVENLKEVDRKKKVEAAERSGETNTANIEGDIYYIEPAEQTDEVNAQIKAITPNSIEPESIQVLDPACGSGHILVEAYQVLKAIYEERGYQPRKIPQLILENNLFGLDIDDRAAQLAGFALMMLARADDRRIFSRDVKLNVLAIQSSKHLNFDNLWQKLDLNKQSKIGTTTSLFDDGQVELNDIIDNSEYQTLKTLLALFEQADTFGSLIQIPDELIISISPLLTQLKELEQCGDSFQKPTACLLIPFIQQAELLAQKYDAVVANPPYMGIKGMNVELKKFAKDNYSDVKSDTFAMFIKRCSDLGKQSANLGFVTPYTWMFISSYEKLRDYLFTNKSIDSLVKPSYTCFFASAIVPLVTFTVQKSVENIKGFYIDLGYLGSAESQPIKLLEAINSSDSKMKYSASRDKFKKIPGSPIAYWVTPKFLEIFNTNETLRDYGINPATGMQTGDNKTFIRCWFEVSDEKRGKKWLPLNDGGDVRKWYGNFISSIMWENDGEKVREHKSSVIRNVQYYFREGATWNRISSSFFAIRYLPEGFIFDQAGDAIFTDSDTDLFLMMGFLNSSIGFSAMKIICPTLNTTAGNLESFPYPKINLYLIQTVKELVAKLIVFATVDWDLYEVSWDFKNNPLIVGLINDSLIRQQYRENVELSDKPTIPTNILAEIYRDWQNKNCETIAEMQRLEQENNRLFIDAYGLQDELTPDVPLEQITLTVNPKYRYGGKLSDEALDNRFQSDTQAELISYAIGCMMGRYSLDQEGLVYAHAGNKGFTELVQQGVYKTFPADDDGIIPLTDQEWFADDTTHRFREFVRVVWGEDNLQTNLDFVAESLCLHAIKAKSSESSLETIRRYLSTQFYKDHLKTYKKRPIYWLFSSGKQKAFECLVYLHRYNDSTLSRMRTEYVTPLLGKYEASAMVLEKQMQDASTTAESNRFKKSLTALEKKQTELSEFDDKLKHYADMRISLDLDDGVKVNYGKFGGLLAEVKAVTGKK